MYEKYTHDNDFVILKLESPLEFNNDVEPACLPSSTNYLNKDSTEERCFTSGWGKLNFNHVRMNKDFFFKFNKLKNMK